jgi:CRISPR system Cascade subunit CasB
MSKITPANEARPSAAPRIGQIVARVAGQLGRAEFSTGERAALRRLDPDNPRAGIGTACRLLHLAGFDVVAASSDQLKRWTLALHAMALMSGPGVDPHDPSKRAGSAFAEAGLSEQRFTRLLCASGPAFREQIPRLARFLAAKGQRLDWEPIARLVLCEGRDEQTAEEIRLRLAAQYYAARAKSERDTEKKGEADA